jgi:prophage tail gpP-like protein
MPKPQEIAVVTALGQKYDIWTTVEVTHSADDVIDHALLTVSEISTGAKNFAAIKLQPGDPATVTLAGQVVISGMVYLRQASYDAKEHGVQIGISSIAQSIEASTVDAAPGQYINQTLQQIGSAVFGRVGVNFSIEGAPAGADMPFPRISEHVGETRFAFIERLCRMRNVHMVDDGTGGIVAFRGPRGTASTTLREGRNILRARLLLKNNDHADDLKMVGMDSGNDSADANRATVGTTTAPPQIGRLRKIVAEEMGSNGAMQLRVQQEKDWDAYQQVDGDVTTSGWLNDQGKLWWTEREKIVTVNSPMLLPENSMQFMIKGIVHRQSSEGGTTTDILLCRQDGLGSGTGEPLKE